MTSSPRGGPTLKQTAVILSALILLLLVTCFSSNDLTIALVCAILIVPLGLVLCVVGVIAFLRFLRGSPQPPSLPGD